MPKNIVVMSDGTGQDGGKDPDSNVYLLFKMLESRTKNQVVFYDRGLGTGWRKLTGNAFGVGISKNIRECYHFIFEHFESEDKVFLFGFSRGAYTVRSLAGFITLCGILPKSRPELIDQAYKIYKISDQSKREQKMKGFREKHNTMNCPIEFVGVWDTVRALGTPFKFMEMLNPFKHNFHDHVLNSNIKNGVHALSIDDERLTFHPTPWDERKISPGQNIVQVWFAGVHSDIGGSYVERGLSDITLDWMLKYAKKSGLLIYPRQKVQIRPDPNGLMHDSRSGFGKLFRKKQRKTDERTNPPKIHQSVLDRELDKNNNTGKYHPWILAENYDVETW